MDVQMSIAPSTPTTSSGGSASAKTSAQPGTTDAFSQLLGSQLTPSTPTADEAGQANAEDPAMMLASLLQMLQSMIMPMQNAPVVQGDETTGDSLPDTLVQAMNSNPSLAAKLLQDPGMQQWLEQASQLIGAMTDGQSKMGSAPMTKAQLAGSDALEAQNTLLMLASLSKQQPDNPILQYLNQQLQQIMEPILPSVAGEQMTPISESDDVQADSNTLENTDSVPASRHIGQHTQVRRADSKKQVISSQAVDMNIQQQPAKSKLEILAVKNSLSQPMHQVQASTNDQVSQEQPVTTDATDAATPFIHILDAQHGVQSTVPVEKAVPATIHAANFAEDMTEHVMKSMKITLADGISEAKLSLFPKNLGHVDVKLTMHDGQLIAQFATDSAAGKQMLESQLPQLRQALQTQGLQVERLEVTQNQSMSSGMFQDQRQQQSSNQAFRQNKNRSGNYEKDVIEFNQEIASAGQTRGTAYGNSFDVIA
ncbi:flagellar hook-length control protein FliK [Paenibacillus hexagrammi]|uniref:Flagellar hook-length control protein FliK n=1 Tax=Paenibacillus hexagrammi TaxID=2908839 RepID=A0ABY3SQ92_9BACL|nr:flagellar hook-length control protein FliK [Paenibacillus sp. YPD9-1]UJF35346.1 flagellar hook-length control protein FliK [Paenibacillus sp. YPD9-1]